ncbi:hypothetical protein PI124_g12259 [Phytophthora idaei]|nr:hypothetical protein PI125_g13050 [Phytophthora idaei]KAG3242920.1 hypothetical protein PI124_g12259 [Phytophthora idaei]
MPRQQVPRRRELTEEERAEVVLRVLQNSVDGVPRLGTMKKVVAGFRVVPSTVSRIWKRALKVKVVTGLWSAASLRHHRGRPTKDVAAKLESLRGANYARRGTLRAASAACGAPRATLHRRVKAGDVRAHVSVVKSLLTEANKAARLSWCSAHIHPTLRLYNDMYDTVRVDEKLFYMTQARRSFYLLPGEPEPERSVRSKRYITKVMMLAAVVRPRWAPSGSTLFDGKLGIWAFVVREPALRSSHSRPAGTMETKEERLNKETYRAMLIERQLPALRERIPHAAEGKRITVQQDNASPHISPQDPAFREATSRMRLSVELQFQPPNSPDLNALDLGIFTAIQSRQMLRFPRSIDELVDSVSEAYWELPHSTLNAAFLSLQCSMDSCIKDKGGNNFKLRHMSKLRLEREGRLSISIRCSDEAELVLSQQ